MSYPYTAPNFLENQSVDDIHQRMLELLPSDVDKSENSVFWDVTRPPATEKAEFVQYELNETIKLIFPQWAYGIWLDYHAQLRNLVRKQANKSSGILEVTGILGTTIPEGFQFATAANVSSISSSILFQSTAAFILAGESNAQGQVTCFMEIEAVYGGIAGNVAKDTIKLMVTPLTGISYISNPEAITGGTEEETDEDLRERVLEAIRTGVSYTGCNSDYIRWAKEVPAVGYVIVDPEWDDPSLPEVFHYTDHFGARRCAGAVRLIIVDENGQPANEQILEAIYLHIMGQDDTDISRLAPIGAHLTVVAPEDLIVNIEATVHLEEGEVLDTVLTRFRTNLSAHWLEIAIEAQTAESGTSSVRFVQVGAVLAKTSGVRDYEKLYINGKTENIMVSQAQYPITGEVIFHD